MIEGFNVLVLCWKVVLRCFNVLVRGCVDDVFVVAFFNILCVCTFVFFRDVWNAYVVICSCLKMCCCVCLFVFAGFVFVACVDDFNLCVVCVFGCLQLLRSVLLMRLQFLMCLMRLLCVLFFKFCAMNRLLLLFVMLFGSLKVFDLFSCV